MKIGVLKEIKKHEYRVALLPSGANVLTKNNHEVLIQSSAGKGSGFSDTDYAENGAKIIDSAEEVYLRAELILKVKEPLEKEYSLINSKHTVFTFFHYAANRQLTESMVTSNAITIAYETVQKSDGSLPLLIPMSEVAGKMAIQVGARYLEKMNKGRGVLLGGVPGVAPAKVLILGAGIVGTNAAFVASGMGADVTILDIDLYKLRYLNEIMPKNVNLVMSNPHNIKHFLPKTDLVIGAILIPGGRAPKLITKDMLKLMREGSVIVDVAVDQGGCIETARPTTHDNPVYVEEGIVHYCVANMPGSVPFTSTVALNNSTFPYVLQIAEKGVTNAVKSNKELWRGVNTYNGAVTYEKVAEAFDMEYTPLENIL
ncbi:alanine dehydrogenase [candidate division KSB1 bacterium]|nr:alanine dehydrogenase [candidate division KSB1 bacterium]